MLKRFNFSLLIIFFFHLAANAQDKSDYRKRFTEGNLLFLEKNYTQALKNYFIAYKIDSANSNINYKMGLCFLNTATERHKALPYLEKAVINTTKKYNDIEPVEKAAPILAYYYYGKALHLNNKFDEAIANYEKFKSFLSDNQTELLNDANRQIEISNYAKELVAAPIKVIIKNMGDSINSPFPDYSAVLSADEKTLIFTSRRPGSTGGDRTAEDEFYEDIYISYKKNNDTTWTSPVSISPKINTIGHEASVGLTADGQTLTIYRDINGGDIYVSHLDKDDQWTAPEPLGSDINTANWETSACLTPDGNTLYFVSDRKGGLGGRDIWRCVKLPNGKWSKAVNLGAPINTPYDEESPFIHPSGNLLFFSSNGHKTIGGFDIFFAGLNDKGKWDEPLNIGYPINTTDDDIFYVTSPDGKRGYYSSASRPEGYGDKDIYMISMPERKEEPLVLIKGKIKDKYDHKLPDELGITVTNNITGATIGIYRPLKDGSFTIIIPPGSNYTISYQDNGNEFYSENMEVPAGVAYQEIEKAVFLKDVTIGEQKINADSLAKTAEPPTDKIAKTTNNVTDNKEENIAGKNTDNPTGKINTPVYQIYFKYNVTQADITEEAFKTFITDIVELYKQKGTINLTIISSASNVPTSKFKGNQELSQVRNNTIRDQIKNALKDKGINEDKIVVIKAKTVVQGPEYKKDAARNKSVYEKYQYIRVEAH